MSRGFKIVLLVLVPLAVAALIWLPFSPGFWLRGNLDAAEAHAPKIRRLLQADARFRHLAVGANPDLEGSIFVLGTLRPEMLPDLEKIVESTHPPRPILWQIIEVRARNP